MNFPLNAIFEALSGASNVRDRIESIIEAAQGRNLHGNRLHYSLVYSGMQMGIGDIQGQFQEAGASLAGHYREMVATLDKLIGKTDDIDHLTELKALREVAQKHLTVYARMLVTIHAQNATQTLGVEEAFFVSGKPVDSYSPAYFAQAGYNASIRDPGYFSLWLRLRSTDKFAEATKPGTCHCQNCFSKLAGVKEDDLERDVELKNALDKEGVNIGGLMEEWGRFLLTSLHEALTDKLAGTTPHDAVHEADATKTAQTFLDSLLRKGGPVADIPEDKE